MTFDQSRPIVVAGADGRVIAQNRSARRMLGHGVGGYCWDFVGQINVDEQVLPCRYGCVMKLLEKGLDCSQQSQFIVGGRRNQLSCVPVNGVVVCMLGSYDGKIGAMLQSLTLREREILALLADGETTASAAQVLGVNESTIRTHVERMRSKLSVNTRAAVVAEGFRRGYLD